MKRTKRATPQRQFPPATFHDGAVIVRIADAGVDAIVAAATKQGLVGAPWDRDALHPEIARVVANALRRTPDWWAGRTGDDA